MGFPPCLVHTPEGSEYSSSSQRGSLSPALPLGPLLTSALGDNNPKDGAHLPQTTAGQPPPPKHHHLGVTFQFSHLSTGLGQPTGPAGTKQLNSHEEPVSFQHLLQPSMLHPFPDSRFHGKGTSPALQPPPGTPVGHLQAGSHYFPVSKHQENKCTGATSGPSPGRNGAQISNANTRIQRVTT